MKALLAVCLLGSIAGNAVRAQEEAPSDRRLPFLAEEARKRGIDLPRPFGIGVVYYHLDRAIEITDVRVGREGTPPTSVPDAVVFGADSKVDNANLKVDVWLLPFLNVYAIAGYIWNESHTVVDVTLPPLLSGDSPRRRRLEAPTSLTGSVAGLGLTLAGGYGPFFFAADCNGARADLGFDDRFKAVVTSIRAGWFGEVGGRPLRVWFNGTDWNTFATATGTVTDPDDGSSLSFEVDQGPAHPTTYGIGASYSPSPSWELSLDSGSDFDGGWYVALVPVFRF